MKVIYNVLVIYLFLAFNLFGQSDNKKSDFKCFESDSLFYDEIFNVSSDYNFYVGVNLTFNSGDSLFYIGGSNDIHSFFLKYFNMDFLQYDSLIENNIEEKRYTYLDISKSQFDSKNNYMLDLVPTNKFSKKLLGMDSNQIISNYFGCDGTIKKKYNKEGRYEPIISRLIELRILCLIHPESGFFTVIKDY